MAGFSPAPIKQGFQFHAVAIPRWPVLTSPKLYNFGIRSKTELHRQRLVTAAPARLSARGYSDMLHLAGGAKPSGFGDCVVGRLPPTQIGFVAGLANPDDVFRILGLQLCNRPMESLIIRLQFFMIA